MANFGEFPNLELGPPEDPWGSRKSEKITDYPGSSSSRANQQPDAARRTGIFAKGDRVLAPWEPNWLYPGTVSEVRDAEVFVFFDDGDRGWVPAAITRPLEIGPGSRVFHRWRNTPFYYPATVDSRNGEQLFLRYDQGPAEYGVLSRVRVPTVVRDDAGEVVQRPVASSAAARGDDRYWLSGERVLAPGGDGWLYTGAVAEVKEDEVHVWFDNGMRRWVAAADMKPMDLGVGSRIFCRWMGGAVYYGGRIKEMRGEQIFIHYDDGDKEWNVFALTRVPGSAGKAFWGSLQSFSFGNLGCFLWLALGVGIPLLIRLLSR